MTTFASYFTPISAKEAGEKLQTEANVILFIGRSTCPYCQRFEPKLTQVSKNNQLTIYFLDSDNQDVEIQELRATYHVPTVPGLLVANEGNVRVVCDSSLSEDEIRDFMIH